MEIISDLIVCLSAAAMISKILIGVRNQTDPIVRQRASNLRQLLGIDEETFPVLFSREVRNTVEHIDELLDRYFYDFEKGGIAAGIHLLEEDPKEGLFVARRLNIWTEA